MARSRKESKGWQLGLLGFFAFVGMVATAAFVGSIFGFAPGQTAVWTHIPCLLAVFWLFKSYFKEADDEKEMKRRLEQFQKDWAAGHYKDVDFNHQILRPLTADDVPPLKE